MLSASGRPFSLHYISVEIFQSAQTFLDPLTSGMADHGAEFIPADPVAHPGRFKHFRDQLCRVLNILIARRMSERVIAVLQIIQIERYNRSLAVSVIFRYPLIISIAWLCSPVGISCSASSR